jgi:hypothetical protein
MFPRTNQEIPVHNLSFQRFAEALGSRADALHRYAGSIVAGRNTEARFVWYTHFLRQTWWVPDAFENRTIFVCYREGSNARDGGHPPLDVLAAASEALARHGIQCDLTALSPRNKHRRGRSGVETQHQGPHLINPTINKSHDIPPYDSLAAGARRYIERTYKWDRMLWERQCANRDHARSNALPHV